MAVLHRLIPAVFVFLLKACQCLKPLETQTYVLLERMLLLMGIYYRYVNDYCDINHIPHFEKGFAMDLEGGPKSFLMILAGKALVKGALLQIKKQIIREYGDAGVFDAALALMEETYGQLLRFADAIKRRNRTVSIHALKGFTQHSFPT